MNPDTRIAVCCYAGDAHQVTEMLNLYTHHECPVTILSPDEYSTVPLDAIFGAYVTPLGSSRVDIPGLDCRYAGKAAIVGQDSIDRQAEHLKILLNYPEKFFLVNDSDSFCLSAKIPDYLYAEPNAVWSNMITDSNPYRSGLCNGPSGEPAKKYYPDGFPKLALQPPYFFSHTVLEKLVAATYSVSMNEHLPFIDHYMTQLAVQAGIPCKGFTDGWSGPISSHPDMPRVVLGAVNNGAVMIHGAKGVKWSAPLLEARRQTGLRA
jgi:hypothetical protein